MAMIQWDAEVSDQLRTRLGHTAQALMDVHKQLRTLESSLFAVLPKGMESLTQLHLALAQTAATADRLQSLCTAVERANQLLGDCEARIKRDVEPERVANPAIARRMAVPPLPQGAYRVDAAAYTEIFGWATIQLPPLEWQRLHAALTPQDSICWAPTLTELSGTDS